MDNLYTIDTPENIEFAYDIAGIGSRFLAAIVDTLLIVLAQVILVFGLEFIISQSELLSGAAQSAINAIRGLLAFVILWGYYIVFEMVWGGQSPGKRVIGLRVVREAGRPITFVNSVVRNFIRLIDFLPAFYGIGVVVMFIDRRARRLGDLAAGTLVVKERRAVTLESLTAPRQTVHPAVQLTLPNLATLSERDYELVQEFLRRRNELSREARQRLGMQLANGIQVRLGLPKGSDPELFLMQVVAEYRALRQQPS